MYESNTEKRDFIDSAPDIDYDTLSIRHLPCIHCLLLVPPIALVSANFSSTNLPADVSSAYTLASGGSRTVPQPVTIDENGEIHDILQQVAVYFSVLDSSGMEVGGIGDVQFKLPIDDTDGLEDGDIITAFYFNGSTGRPCSFEFIV